ncbi:MAG: hypothetical protein HKN47_06595 [Pirellulaceae bacterium]|nr:hypothetical protein [Pirellulaceae bacterium]
MIARQTWLTLVVTALMIASGCNRFENKYGVSSGVVGRTSVNGFGALRDTFETSGFQTRDVHRFNTRVQSSRVIVWTPQVPGSVGPKVTRWIEKWLRGGRRTLVYIVPDSGSEAEYWIEAGKIAPPSQRLEYRRRAAQKLNERMQWTINRRAVPTNGWFVLKPHSEISDKTKISSSTWDLTSTPNDVPDDVPDDSKEQLLTEYTIEPYEKPDPTAPKTAATKPAAAPAIGPTGATGPAAPFTMPGDRYVSRTGVTFRPLVKTESGAPIVAEITSKQWTTSRIIVVASGSLLTNYAFTRELNRELANEVVLASKAGDSFGPPVDRNSPVAGFLLSSWMPIPVSERAPGVPRASGMELMTVWPMSMVTIHAALLGLVVCVMLFPVFGRARSVDRGTTSHFGDHLDAVATLMSSARGEDYARNRISEYMRRMKGETSGTWVLPEKPRAPQLKNIQEGKLGAKPVVPTNDQAASTINETAGQSTAVGGSESQAEPDISGESIATVVGDASDIPVEPSTNDDAGDDAGSPPENDERKF